MRRILLLAGGLVALVLVCVASAFLLIDVNRFRGPIRKELESRLGRPVAFGSMGLSLIPLAVRADEVSVGESSKFPTGRPFAAARGIRVRAGLLPLLRGEVRVDSLVLDRPVVELVRNRAGQWNFSDLTNRPQTGGGGRPVELSSLRIDDGTLALTDQASRSGRILYEHLDVSIRDFAPGRRFGIEAAIQVPGAGRRSVSLQGSGEGGQAFRGRLTLREAPLSGLGRMVGARLPLEGLLSGATEVNYAGPVLTLAPSLELNKAAANGKTAGVTLRLDSTVAYNTDSGILKVGKARLAAGKVAIEASGEAQPQKSTVKARLHLPETQLGDALAVARLFGAGGLEGSGIVSLDAAVDGRLPGALEFSGNGSLRQAEIRTAAMPKPVRIPAASLRFDRDGARAAPLQFGLAGSSARGSITVRNFASPELTFDLDVDRIDVAELEQLTSSGGSPAGAPPLSAKGVIRVGQLNAQGVEFTDVRSECRMEKGILTLSPLAAKLFGGTHSGSIVVDTNARPAAAATKLQLERVDANRLLSAATSVKQVLYGLLNASGQIAMNAGAEPARTLNGELSLRLTEGRLAGVNLMNELSGVARFLGYSAPAQKFTDIVQLAGDIKLTGGVASTENLRLEIAGASLSAAGTADLADQTVNMKLLAVLDRATSDKVGGSKVGGMLQTALANSRGELVIPAVVTGRLSAPRFAPDAARVAEMKLKNLIQPPAGAGGRPGVRGVIDSMFRKKK